MERQTWQSKDLGQGLLGITDICHQIQMSIHHKKYQICLLLNVNLHILVQGQFLPHLRWHEINGKYRIVLLLTLDIFALLAFKTFAKSCFVGTLAAEMGNCVCEQSHLL